MDIDADSWREGLGRGVSVRALKREACIMVPHLVHARDCRSAM